MTQIRGVVAVALAAVLLIFIGGVTPAQATVSTAYCQGRSYKTVVKNYTRGSAALPLRCGSSKWGFSHILSRWGASFDSNIALTISRGEAVSDLQQDGGSTIYALFNTKCTELFRVIYNKNAYNGNGVTPQGLITAYAPNYSTVAPMAASYAAGTSYRTDCPVYQGI